MSKKILVVDDDPKICELLSDILRDDGFAVAAARTTESAWEQVAMFGPDLIILDVEIPTKGGLQFCREIKEKKQYQKIPIMFLTVLDQEMDVVSALRLGGDDFITKPFRPKELLARIHVTLRRSNYFQETVGLVRSGTLFMDFEKRMVKINNRECSLSPKEFDLLHFLYTNRQRPLNDREIFEHIWGAQCNSMRSTVYTHLNQLRKKLGKHGSKIRTVPGRGFRFDERSK